MNDIIPIIKTAVGNEEVNTVNALDLHAALEVRSEFRNWLRRRIVDCMLVGDEDIIIAKNDEPGFTKKTEYYLTLDAAKQLAIMERNDKGFMIRQFFIDFEKKAKEMLPKKTFEELTLEVILGLQGRIAEQQRLLEEQAPKVEVCNRWLDSDGYYSLDVAGKLLGHPNKAKFCDLLRTLGMLTKEKKPKSKDGKSRGYKNEPTTAYAELGWFVTKPWENGKGFSGTAIKVTKIGLLGLTEMFTELKILGEACMLMPNAPELTQLN